MPVEVTTNQIDYCGRHIVCAFSRDISERVRNMEALRESEERFRGIIENYPSAIFLTDRSGRFRLVNSMFETWYGHSAAEIMGRAPDDIFPQYLAELTAAMDREVFATETPAEQECEAPLADGATHTLVVAKYPVRDGLGNIVGVGTIHRDITEHKETDEKLRQSQKMEAMGQLTGGVAYGFNNLLAVISGSFELIEKCAGGDARLGKLAERGLMATERGAALAHRLLAFSRKQILLPSRLDLNRLVRDITDLLQRTLGEGVDVHIREGKDLWPCFVDQGQLENALLNLSINARDAMPGGGRLHIETANLPLIDADADAEADVEPGDYLMLKVSDTGGGISEESLQHVFEQFFTTKEAGKGTGLGLSMVHGFAKQSGGNVAIASELGVGTSVSLYLPRSAAEATAETRDTGSHVAAGAGETILVVEDNEAVREIAEELLDELSYLTVSADSGPAALAVLKRDAPIDLLLTDVVLPGVMNGPMLAEEIRRLSRATPIVFMTGYAKETRDDLAGPDGQVRLLQKPFRKS
ncbi:MAG: hypothetical protein CMM31_01115 [Rhodospirillaceae bacterium]|nr:hypothetical protein [Rhodospirillaceae bacterium]